MREIGAFEAKNKLAALLDQVEKGEEVVITRHGRAVALLVPFGSGNDRTAAFDAAMRIRARARSLRSGPFRWDVLKAERDLDRP